MYGNEPTNSSIEPNLFKSLIIGVLDEALAHCCPTMEVLNVVMNLLIVIVL